MIAGKSIKTIKRTGKVCLVDCFKICRKNLLLFWLVVNYLGDQFRVNCPCCSVVIYSVKTIFLVQRKVILG